MGTGPRYMPDPGASSPDTYLLPLQQRPANRAVTSAGGRRASATSRGHPPHQRQPGLDRAEQLLDVPLEKHGLRTGTEQGRSPAKGLPRAPLGALSLQLPRLRVDMSPTWQSGCSEAAV